MTDIDRGDLAVMTTLADFINDETSRLIDQGFVRGDEVDFHGVTTYAIRRFIGYDGAHAALMDHPKTLAAPLVIALMAKTAKEAADLTDPETLTGVRQALDAILAEHAVRQHVTKGK